MIGTSRVKRQQQEIDRLNAENASLHEQIGTLNRANREEKARHEQAEQQLQTKLDRIEHWLPDTQTLISWGEYCRDMGLSESGAREIIAMKPLYVSGELRARSIRTASTSRIPRSACNATRTAPEASSCSSTANPRTPGSANGTWSS